VLDSNETETRNAPGVAADEDSPAYIALLLRRLLDQRCLLTVTVGNDPETYTSAVLEVVRDEGYLVLDELSPQGGHERVLDTRRLNVRARLDGIDIRFAARVTQIGDQDGLPFYKLPLPTRIDYPQRRQSYRVPVPMNRGLPVTVLLPEGRELSGELRDISPDGLCARIKLGSPDPRGDRGAVAICRLKVDATRELVTDIEVCHVDAPLRGRVPRLGARFVMLRPDQARRIEQFCAELAREQRRVR
jgi:c-di-GMP-binding flagellar brake protein YcgR